MVGGANGAVPEPAATTVNAAAALEGLLRTHRTGLYCFLRRHIPSDLDSFIDPQDILQEVYIEAFRRLREFPCRDGDGLAFGWLLTVARNRLINLIARHRSRKRGGGRTPMLASQGFGSDGDVSIMLEELAVYERTPSRSALAHEAAAALERSLDTLPEDYRRAIRMRYMDQLPFAEIAVALGRSQRAAEMVCTRAIARLRVAMGTQWR